MDDLGPREFLPQEEGGGKRWFTAVHVESHEPEQLGVVVQMKSSTEVEAVAME